MVVEMLVCNLRHFPGEIWNWFSRHRGQGEPKESRGSRLAGGSFNKRGNYTPGLLTLSTKWVNRSPSAPAGQNLKKLLRGMNWIQWHIPATWPQQHLTLSGCVIKDGSYGGKGGQEVHTRDRGGGVEESTIALGSKGDHALWTTSSKTPPLVSASQWYISPSPQCAVDGQQGVVSLAWRPLLWQLSGCLGADATVTV